MFFYTKWSQVYGKDLGACLIINCYRFSILFLRISFVYRVQRGYVFDPFTSEKISVFAKDLISQSREINLRLRYVCHKNLDSSKIFREHIFDISWFLTWQKKEIFFDWKMSIYWKWNWSLGIIWIKFMIECFNLDQIYDWMV